MDADKIVGILKRYQSILSDGYEYYVRHSADPESDVVPTVDGVLKEIAKEIIQSLKKETVVEPTVLPTEANEKIKESKMGYSHLHEYQTNEAQWRAAAHENMAYTEDFSEAMYALPELFDGSITKLFDDSIRTERRFIIQFPSKSIKDLSWNKWILEKVDRKTLSSRLKSAIDRVRTDATMKQDPQEWKFKRRRK